MESESARVVGPLTSGGLWRRITQVLRLIRLKPFDVEQPGGRAAERNRRIVLTGLISVVSRAIGILTVLLTVRLTAQYLGNERYGLWLTISSFTMMFGFADLGVTNGLLNALSDADGRDDREAAARYVSSAFFMLTFMSLMVGLIFAIVYPFVAWQRVCNVKSPLAIAEAAPSMAMMVGCFLAAMPLSIVGRVQAAYQDGFAATGWNIAGQLAGLGAVVYGVRHHAGVPMLILGLSGAPLLTNVVNSLIVFGFQRRWLFPSLALFNFQNARKLLNVGVVYVLLGVCSSMAFFADNFIVAQVLGADAVPQYSIPMRLFLMPNTIVMMFLGALWPAYGEANARQDFGWIRRTLRRSLISATGLSLAAAVFLFIAHRWIIHIWVGDQITTTTWLASGMAIWCVMGSIGNAIAMFLNGMHLFQLELAVGASMAVLNVLLSVVLARMYGLPGVIWGTVISYSLCTFVPCWIYIPRILKVREAAAVSLPVAKPTI